MGGEYLPDLKTGEIEIARITLKSTTLDVISIRARKSSARISYRMVDEYGEHEYALAIKSSKEPLTLQQVIKLIDSAEEGGLVAQPKFELF